MTGTKRTSVRSAIAVIDIGTNSTLMLIASIESGKVITLGQWAETTRLGRDLVRTGRIGEAGCHDTLQTLRKFQEIAREYTDRIHPVGTQVFRAASNRDQIIRQIQSQTGLSVEVLTEIQEATYGFRGVLTGIQADEILVFDVGGGSVELIRGGRNRPSAVTSLPMGAVSLTERYFTHDPPDPAERRALKAAFESSIQKVWLNHLRAALPWVCIGGTGTTLAACRIGMKVYDASRLDHFYLSRGDLRVLLDELIQMDLQRRRAYLQIDPGRADIIIAGSLIIETLLELGAKEKCRISDRGLRYGIASRELQPVN
jgi:exopolyphosphatase/guanosine-5'-triphosphate,3'-diphosphate pyrophosphatase